MSHPDDGRMTVDTEMSSDHRIGRGWVWFTTVALWAIFLQSVTAGRILSGDDWARTAHRATGHLSSLIILAAGLAALALLRQRNGGRRFAVVLVALAVCLLVEAQLGTAAADGEDTLWLHIPFGVAIVAFAARASMLARQLESSRGDGLGEAEAMSARGRGRAGVSR
jgi:hypothetical protein